MIVYKRWLKTKRKHAGWHGDGRKFYRIVTRGSAKAGFCSV